MKWNVEILVAGKWVVVVRNFVEVVDAGRIAIKLIRNGCIARTKMVK